MNLLLTVVLFFGAICFGIRGSELPYIVFVTGEYEYHSAETFPKFAAQLEKEYLVRTAVLARPADEKIQSIPQIGELAKADLLILMMRRMTLPEEQLAKFKTYFESGKPLIGLRTASHSFQNWLEFDKIVLGGNYGNHYGNSLKTTVSVVPEARDHPIMRGVTGFVSEGSLYRNTPLQPGCQTLLIGTIPVHPPEPVAWTHEYKGARVFYSSLGHPADFDEPSFDKLLHNAIEWALGKSLPTRNGK